MASSSITFLAGGAGEDRPQLSEASVQSTWQQQRSCRGSRLAAILPARPWFLLVATRSLICMAVTFVGASKPPMHSPCSPTAGRCLGPGGRTGNRAAAGTTRRSPRGLPSAPHRLAKTWQRSFFIQLCVGAHTIYECSACDVRYLSERRCSKCNHHACRALGLGGACQDRQSRWRRR